MLDDRRGLEEEAPARGAQALLQHEVVGERIGERRSETPQCGGLVARVVPRNGAALAAALGRRVVAVVEQADQRALAEAGVGVAHPRADRDPGSGVRGEQSCGPARPDARVLLEEGDDRRARGFDTGRARRGEERVGRQADDSDARVRG